MGFLFLFLVLPILCFCVYIESDKLDRLCRPQRYQITTRNWLRTWQCTNSVDDYTENVTDYFENDRQGNAFAIHDETSRERRYDDIFFIEPNSVEAARIRAQLEKDEKDLPSYEEVMRMANLSSPTSAPAANTFGTVAAAPGGAVSINASSSSVNTTETTLNVPPYIEVDLSTRSNATRSVTPPPYFPPISANSAVILAITASVQTQQISSNV